MNAVALLGALLFSLQEPPASIPAQQDAADQDSTRGGLSIAPAAGYLTTRGADRGTWFGGIQARAHLSPVLAVEGSATFHQSLYSDGDIVVTQYPVQVTGLLYPFGETPFRPYVLAGAGWYYTRTHYRGTLDLLYEDQTEHDFGAHFGAGAEALLGPRVTLDADVRYIFLNPTVDGVKERDFNYWQATAGLNFRF